MKYQLFLWICLLSCLVACQDDDEIGFDIPVEFPKDLEFKPAPGGAIMKYYLPKNNDILGIRARYNDEHGTPLVVEGSYQNDSLILLGFNEPTQNVPVQISFFNNSMEESGVKEYQFSTLASAAVAFFDGVQVNSFWGGFNVIYDAPETTSGMAHVFYLGVNPLTHEPDTILVTSTPIIAGGDTLNFVLKQNKDLNTVIIRTEDRGKRVKQQIFPDMPALYMDTLKSSDFDFDFTGTIVENEEYQIGKQYALDGDKVGISFYRNRKLNGIRYGGYATFVAGPNAFGERFIVDLKTERIPASVRLYAYLNYGSTWPATSNPYHPAYLASLWNGSYLSRLPSEVTLYGTNEDPRTVDLSQCTVLHTFKDSPNASSWRTREAWCKETDDEANFQFSVFSKSEAEILSMTPIYLDLLCNYSGDSYRYLIFVVNDTYDSTAWYGREMNQSEYITFNELEVCVKKE